MVMSNPHLNTIIDQAPSMPEEKHSDVFVHTSPPEVTTPSESQLGHSVSNDDDEIYRRFSPYRKLLITLVVSVPGFNGSTDSMLINSAIPEVAAEFNTTGNTINISNGLYILFMALSPIFWGPLSQVYGRRPV
jgi:hypothetical protein